MNIKSLFQIVIQALVGVTSYSLHVGMFSSWAQSIAAIPITSLHPDDHCTAMNLGFCHKEKRTIKICCKLLECWCKVYAVTTPEKGHPILWFSFANFSDIVYHSWWQKFNSWFKRLLTSLSKILPAMPVLNHIWLAEIIAFVNICVKSRG